MTAAASASDSTSEPQPASIEPTVIGGPLLAAVPEAQARADGAPPRGSARRAPALLLACAAALAIGWIGHVLELRWQPRLAKTATARVSQETRTEPSRVASRAALKEYQEAASDTLDTSLPAAAPTLAAGEDTTGCAPFAAGPRLGGVPCDSETSALSSPERVILEELRSQPISRIKLGSGGRSLAFKLTLADGTRGYYKPEQAVSSASWRAEVIAFHLDRALGLGRVPPVVSRAVPWTQLAPVARDDRRVSEVVVQKNGKVRGAFVYWLSQKLVPATTPPGWENWVRVEPFARWSISPYQSSAAFGAALKTARAESAAGRLAKAHYEEIPRPSRAELPAELSDVIVFDFLTINYDRWGGDNTNLLTLGSGGPLIFLDNGDAFSLGPARRSLLDARLKPLQRFRKRTIDALKALDVARLGETLAHDAQGPLLDARGIEGLAVRRKVVLEHVAAQEERFGSAVYAW